MVENVFNLQTVFVILVALAKDAKLFGEVQAFRKIFWSDEVQRDFDAIVDVQDLVWCAGGDENGIAFVLNDCVTDDVIFLQALAETLIDVPVLLDDKRSLNQNTKTGTKMNLLDRELDHH